MLLLTIRLILPSSIVNKVQPQLTIIKSQKTVEKEIILPPEELDLNHKQSNNVEETAILKQVKEDQEINIETKTTAQDKNQTPKKYIRRFSPKPQSIKDDSKKTTSFTASVMEEQVIIHRAKITMVLADNSLIHPEVFIESDTAQLILKLNSLTYKSQKMALPIEKRNRWMNKKLVLGNKQEFKFSTDL
ncbi:hypothetical protein [Chondrinema litorale]|uniref:hypothetical protein n=1 Tax=Chondrinema litorale TaxID=2994555 RepID=UPI002542807D|nr:hypothetical protein [Chondrinema litorale]UZR99819.1 hypothetical protein OQ292_38605 [Chondrinema litorale]